MQTNTFDIPQAAANPVKSLPRNSNNLTNNQINKLFNNKLDLTKDDIDAELAKYPAMKSLLDEGFSQAPDKFYTYKYAVPDPLLTTDDPAPGRYNLINLKELYETINPEYLTIQELCYRQADKKIRLPLFKSIIQTICKNSCGIIGALTPKSCC